MLYRDREERLNAASAKYEEVMTSPGPPPMKPYYDAGVVGFVFGEMWPRPALSRRDRRWVTLACVGAMGAVVPIQTHFFAALNSGDCTIEELEEFNLFFASQCGWPRAGGRPVHHGSVGENRVSGVGHDAVDGAQRRRDAAGTGNRGVRGDHVRACARRRHRLRGSRLSRLPVRRDLDPAGAHAS